MTPEDFKDWLDHMREARGWSGAECARRLGAGANQPSRWKVTGAPRYIALAAAALAYGMPPWSPRVADKA